MQLGEALPKIRSPLPAEKGRAWVERLAGSECPALTTRRKRREERTGASHDPIVWVEARGANVIDADGNRYVDLTSGFGAAFIGHGHPKVVSAVRGQANRLLHALGDLHPSDVKIELLERLCGIGPWTRSKAMLSLGGGDAVTAALKTAVLATGKTGVVAFEGGYHGLSYGPLSVSAFSPRFRAPFAGQLQSDVLFAKWPADVDSMPAALDSLPTDWSRIGAVIVEPVQGRAGVRLPPAGFLGELEARCKRYGAVLIVDEIFTGVGRCGAWWRSVDCGVTPDLICAGKALGGGLPVSACIGNEEVMRAWGDPDREAIHTGTFFGDPIGAAAALATLDVIEEGSLPQVAAARGKLLEGKLVDARLPAVMEVRGVGLMLGLQLRPGFDALTASRALLERGFLVLPAGADADVIQLAPPVTITSEQVGAFVAALGDALEER